MHVIHHTEAIVLKSTTHGEANKRVWLFTREFGLVVATVQGVRKPGAKLMGHSADYSLLRVDLVKGREVWRLISATTLLDPVTTQVRAPMVRAYVRTLSALSRFLVDEGVNDELYNHIIETIDMVQLGTFDARLFDALSLWRVFIHLGYIAIEEQDESLLTLSLSAAYDQMTEQNYARIIESIKSAIEQSHL